MNKVVMYQTSDNKLWPTEAEAKKQQAIIDSAGKLSSLLKATMTTMRPEALLRHILDEHTAVTDILKEFAKKLPKEKKVS